MADEKKLLVAADISRDFTELAYFIPDSMEPRPFVPKANGTAVRIVNGNLLEALEKGIGQERLSRHLAECLHIFDKFAKPEEMAVIVTMRNQDRFLKNLKKALLDAGVKENAIFFSDYPESVYSYVTSARGIRKRNEILVLDGQEETIRALYLEIRTEGTIPLACVQEAGKVDLEENLLEGEIPDAEERDQRLLHMLQHCAEGREITTVFLVGQQITQEEYPYSLEFLSGQRPVYQSNHVFAIGACYTLMISLGLAKQRTIRYLGQDYLKASMFLPVQAGGENRDFPLAKPGVRYDRLETKAELILNGRNFLVLKEVGFTDQKTEERRFYMEGLPKRPNRTIRLRVCLSFEDRNTAVLRAEDVGFGELYPSSGRYWEWRFTPGSAAQKYPKAEGVLELCMAQKARNPFFIPVLQQNLYTLEELLFCITENICLMDEQVINESLIDWLDSALGRRDLAETLYGAVRNGEDCDGLILLLLKKTGYFDPAQRKKFRETIRVYRGLRPEMQKKLQADTLQENRLYAQAEKRYREILADEERSRMGAEFFAKVCNNHAMACLGIGEAGIAAQSMEKACRLFPSPELIKRTAILMDEVYKEDAAGKMKGIPGGQQALLDLKRGANLPKTEPSFPSWEQREAFLRREILQYRRNIQAGE